MTPAAPAAAMARTWAGWLTPNPTADGHRRVGGHVADELADAGRQLGPRPGHPDQRHAVQEAAAARGRCAPRRSGAVVGATR